MFIEGRLKSHIGASKKSFQKQKKTDFVEQHQHHYKRFVDWCIDLLAAKLIRRN